jgi:hypothetical protein
MMTGRLFSSGALCALAFAAAGCGDSTGTSATAPAPAAVRIEVIEPAASLLVGPVRVRASCSGGCRSVEAFVSGNGTETRIAQGTDSISLVYPVADLGIPTVRFVFRATDTSGRVTSLETPEMGVALGPWTRVYAVDGTLLDATPDRALYVDAKRGLRMLEVHSGGNPELMSLVRTGLTRGFVNDSGAVADLGPPGVGSTGNAPWGIWEWGGSTLTGGRYGGSPRALGRWAAWTLQREVVGADSIRHYDVLYRDDVLRRVVVRTPDSLSVESYDLAEDGTIAFAARPSLQQAMPAQLFVWRGGDAAQLTFDPAVSVRAPATDGTAFVYLLAGSGIARRLIYRGSGGAEEALTPWIAPANEPLYQLLGGWTAFSYPDGAGVSHVWARTPAGEVHQVWPGHPATLVSAGPRGEVVLAANGALYLSDAPHAEATPLGGWGTARAKWIGGRLYLLKDGGLYRLDR